MFFGKVVLVKYNGRPKYNAMPSLKPDELHPARFFAERHVAPAAFGRYVACAPVDMGRGAGAKALHAWVDADAAAGGMGGYPMSFGTMRGPDGNTIVEYRDLLYTCALPTCGKPCGFKACSLCGEVFYCDKACQRKHWKAGVTGHKATCTRACTGSR